MAAANAKDLLDEESGDLYKRYSDVGEFLIGDGLPSTDSWEDEYVPRGENVLGAVTYLDMSDDPGDDMTIPSELGDAGGKRDREESKRSEAFNADAEIAWGVGCGFGFHVTVDVLCEGVSEACLRSADSLGSSREASMNSLISLEKEGSKVDVGPRIGERAGRPLVNDVGGTDGMQN